MKNDQEEYGVGPGSKGHYRFIHQYSQNQIVECSGSCITGKGRYTWPWSVDNVVAVRNVGDNFRSVRDGSKEIPHNCLYTSDQYNGYNYEECAQYFEPGTHWVGGPYNQGYGIDECTTDSFEHIKEYQKGSSTKYLFNRTLNWIDSVSDGGRAPFYAHVATWTIHTPFTGNEKSNNKAKTLACLAKITIS